MVTLVLAVASLFYIFVPGLKEAFPLLKGALRTTSSQSATARRGVSAIQWALRATAMPPFLTTNMPVRTVELRLGNAVKGSLAAAKSVWSHNFFPLKVSWYFL